MYLTVALLGEDRRRKKKLLGKFSSKETAPIV